MENNVGAFSALSPYLGYEKSSKIAKEALKKNKDIRNLIVKEYDISKIKLNEILDFYEMTKNKNSKK